MTTSADFDPETYYVKLNPDMNKLDQITYAPLRQSVKQLYFSCDELETDDELRNAELANIRQIIHVAVQDIIDGNISDADETLTLVKKRLNFLAENPGSAGNHEAHRDTWPAPEPEIEVMPRSEKRPKIL